VWGGYPRPTGRLFATAARKQAHYRLAPRRVPHQTRIAVAACSPSNLFNLFNLFNLTQFPSNLFPVSLSM
jgi:hypothetical protein